MAQAVDGKWYGRKSGQCPTTPFQVGPYDTKERCAIGTFEELECDSADVGRLRLFVPEIDADNIIDQLSCEAQDAAGEVAEDWLMHVPKNDQENLSLMLTTSLEIWLEKRGLMPTFGSIYDEETLTKEQVDKSIADWESKQ